MWGKTPGTGAATTRATPEVRALPRSPVRLSSGGGPGPRRPRHMRSAPPLAGLLLREVLEARGLPAGAQQLQMLPRRAVQPPDMRRAAIGIAHEPMMGRIEARGLAHREVHQAVVVLRAGDQRGPVGYDLGLRGLQRRAGQAGHQFHEGRAVIDSYIADQARTRARLGPVGRVEHRKPEQHDVANGDLLLPGVEKRVKIVGHVVDSYLEGKSTRLANLNLEAPVRFLRRVARHAPEKADRGGGILNTKAALLKIKVKKLLHLRDDQRR